MLQEDFKKQILNSIKQSGFPTELKVSKYFNKREWTVLNNYIYFDNDKKVNREIDFLCIRGATGNQFSKLQLKLYLTIEVKKSEKNPWVFFVTKNEPTYLEHGFFSSTSYRNINLDIKEGIFQDYPRQKCKYAATSHFEAFRKDESQRKESEISNIHRAIESSTKATYYFQNGNELNQQKKNLPPEEFANDLFGPLDLKRPSVLNIFIPVIVFEGVLIKGELDNTSQIEIEETDFIPYESYYIDEAGIEHFYAIDVMSISYMSKYLRAIEKWLDALGERILKSRTL